jgi:twitching motility protein PilT
MANFNIEYWPKILQYAIEKGASDIHLSPQQVVFFRIQGELQPINQWVPEESAIKQFFDQITNEKQRIQFQQNHDLDFAWTYAAQRFRMNAFYQRGLLSLAIRVIPMQIPTLSALGMPALLTQLLDTQHGLILITGRTGAGKSTTMASFIDAVNQRRALHIITLEDPIEYLHTSGKSLIQQREYNADFFSFSTALRSALREDPDIIVVGELRDAETIAAALNAAETGHLVLGSLHTQSAAETVLRLESFFPAEQQGQIRAQLAIVLSAIFAQQLVPALNGGRVCAVEAMAASPAIRNLIRTGNVQQMKSSIMSGGSAGMQTMEQSMNALARLHQISAETAQRYFR